MHGSGLPGVMIIPLLSLNVLVDLGVGMLRQFGPVRHLRSVKCLGIRRGDGESQRMRILRSLSVPRLGSRAN